jgi:hypothetical protein
MGLSHSACVSEIASEACHDVTRVAVWILCRPAAAAPVVGWPPVRAFRRNLGAPKPASLNREASSHGRHDAAAAGGMVEAGKKGLFVKVNMDGVPIGRKVDLAAHGGYDGLSAAVDQLFRGLLAGTGAVRADRLVLASVRTSMRRLSLVCSVISSSVWRGAEGDHRAVERQRRVRSGLRGRRGRPDAGGRRAVGVSTQFNEPSSLSQQLVII